MLYAFDAKSALNPIKIVFCPEAWCSHFDAKSALNPIKTRATCKYTDNERYVC